MSLFETDLPATFDPIRKTSDSELVKQLPSWTARWLHTMLLVASFFLVQIIVAMPVMLWVVGTQGVSFDNQAVLQQALTELSLSAPGAWIAVIAGTLASLLTLLLAWIWPVVWNRLLRQQYDNRIWLAAIKPLYLPVWMVVPLTFILAVVLSAAISLLLGQPEVATQTLIFSTPTLQIVALPLVSTATAVAEEFIFRGSLYNALLPRERKGWVSELPAFFITSVTFAGVHLLVGFEDAAAIVMVLLLAFFLGLLRLITRSVWASTAAHMSWNLLAAVGLLLSSVSGI